MLWEPGQSGDPADAAWLNAVGALATRHVNAASAQGNNLRILHITETHSRAAGGVTTVVHNLIQWLTAHRVENALLTTGESEALPERGAMQINLTSSSLARRWAWSPDLVRTVEEVCERWRPDVLHLHGAWLAPQLVGAQVAARWRIPFVATFHGMLDPYHWTDRGLLKELRKKLYWRALGARAFSKANVIHAITPLEGRTLARFFPGCTIKIVPNAVDLDFIDAQLSAAGEVSRERVLGFVGRMHPIKGIDALIDAFYRAKNAQGWRLVLAGPETSSKYQSALDSRIRNAPKDRYIQRIGTLRGEDLWKFFRSAWCVAVPSRSEVMGMVNLEAAACGTFTLTTPETGLSDWEEGGGILVGNDVAALTEALERVCGMSGSERELRGAKSRELIAKKYSWSVAGEQWLDLYHSVAREHTI
ncbi:MAG: glycosyltransferase [Gemmatimonadaceae bacterium]